MFRNANQCFCLCLTAVFFTCYFDLPAGISHAQLVAEPTTSKRYQKYVNDIMKKADVDEDGVIDRSEMKKLDRPLFENADSNGDGLISSEEILAQISGPANQAQPLQNDSAANTNHSIETNAPTLAPKTLNLKFSVLRLPRSFSQHHVVSIEDILKKVSGRDAEQEVGKIAGDSHVQLMDQFEMTVVNGNTSSLTVEGETVGNVFKSNRGGQMVWQQAKQPFESSIEVTPRIKQEFTQLNVTLNASYAFHSPYLPSDKKNDLREIGITPVCLRVNSTFLFDNEKISTTNIFSSGHHFLLVIRIDD